MAKGMLNIKKLHVEKLTHIQKYFATVEHARKYILTSFWNRISHNGLHNYRTWRVTNKRNRRDKPEFLFLSKLLTFKFLFYYTPGLRARVRLASTVRKQSSSQFLRGGGIALKKYFLSCQSLRLLHFRISASLPDSRHRTFLITKQKAWLVTRRPRIRYRVHPHYRLRMHLWGSVRRGVEMARRYSREFEVHASNVGAQLEIELSSTREVVRCLYNVLGDCNAETIRSEAG